MDSASVIIPFFWQQTSRFGLEHYDSGTFERESSIYKQFELPRCVDVDVLKEKTNNNNIKGP